MERMNPEWIEKIYAGWLAKIVGIRLGAPVESWTYEKIKAVYGELEGYPVSYSRFAADDDSNGPLFFLRALEDCGKDAQYMTADDVGEALLNYAPFEHGFFWWGGYGCSTEHTAYLNLRAGIPAPRSGSIEQNGSTMAEQIGGQIFIDTWGLAAPGNPDLAASLAARAASVTHGGEGINGGVFVAACISWAFVEQNITAILEKGLSYLPEGSRYAALVREIMAFHQENPEDWEKCFAYIHQNHGYDKYPGNCHILPNLAVMILALLYGEGDFARTLNICNRCGWDTDCNVGNVATIMGVRGGLAAIPLEWRRPINDFLACSSVVGSLNIQDIPYGAGYIARLAWALAGEPLPEPYRKALAPGEHNCHFEFPGSTHAIEARVERADPSSNQKPEVFLRNTSEEAHTGCRSLRACVKPVTPGMRVCLFQRTYLGPEDFQDSRYDPAFSPLTYPGQTVHASVKLPEGADPCLARLYARDARTGELYLGDAQKLDPGEWLTLCWRIPSMKGVLLDETGAAFEIPSLHDRLTGFSVYLDDLYVDGPADYTVDFTKEETHVWTGVHREISQFTRLKGNFFLENGQAHLSCSDFGEAYTGRYDWTDYEAEFTLQPTTGEQHFACIRVQGGVRCYYAGFLGSSLVILKNTRHGIKTLATVPFQWNREKTYTLYAGAHGNQIFVQTGETSLAAEDEEQPYLRGGIGLAVREGSHLRCSEIIVRPLR